MPEIEEANTIKFSTLIWFMLGLIVPLWPLSLPFFWWLAYKSYKKGGPAPVSLYELKKAQELLESGGITKEEFTELKKRASQINTQG